MKKQLLFLVMTLLPLIAHADYGGTCGDNLTWTLVAGTLTIEGSGVMKDYSYGSAPWYRTGFSTVVIGDGVTNIGNYAFCECTGLTSINIPNSVTSIGNSAFQNCSGLASVTIGNGVTSIGDRAFYGCSSLTSIEIPNSVTSIGNSAFYYCSGLTSINIPNSTTSIGNSAFQNCSGLTSVIIGNGVTSIGSSVFYGCSGLISVTIPNSVTSIGGGAFQECSDLTSVIIPNGITSIGGSTFEGCTSLTSVNIPNGVTSIGDRAFYGCSGLTSIEIPNSVTSIGSGAFYGSGWYNEQNDGILYLCNWLLGYKGNRPTGDLKIVNGTKYICNRAFYNCDGLSSVTIPNSVTSIGDYAFYGCSGLKSIEIPNSVTSIGSSAFEGCSRLISITIPNSITSLGESVFSGCSGLTSITIPNSVTSIGNYTFSGCSGLTSVTIPNSVTSIGYEAFYNCKSLVSVTLSKELMYISVEAFYSCYRLACINCLNPVPPSTFHDTFICKVNDYVRDEYDIYNYAILNVPKGSKDAYSSAYEWRYFKNIKEIGENSEQVSFTNLTIQLGTTGFTRQSVKTLESYTFYIGSYGENKVNAVTFNGEDVTNRVNNGYYTTPEITSASVLSVTYETTSSAVQAVKQSNLKVMGYNGEINVENIESASDVTVYTVDGKLVDSIPSAFGSVRLQVPSNQLYIVKVANRTFKLAM